MSVRIAVLVVGGLVLTLAAACSDGGGGREVHIVAHAEDCTPTSIPVTPGEELTIVVDNEAGGDREVEGIEGTRLQEVLVPDGRTRELDYTVPDGDEVQHIKCYIPDGPSTVIELVPNG